MAPHDWHERALRAEEYYKQQLKDKLEATHRESFVAIEVDSGDYYISESDREAVDAARRAHPDKHPHLIRIGHAAAFFVGGCYK